MITETIVSDIGELTYRLNEFPNHFVFRGHANASWSLATSLERVLGPSWSEQTAVKAEEYAIQTFESKFHLYDRENVTPESKLAWLSLLQHYGAPTRMLDFTESPYVALFFCLEGYAANSNVDFAIYAIDYRALMKNSLDYICSSRPDFHESHQSLYSKRDQVFDTIINPNSYDIAWITEPTLVNVRLDRQAGSFLISGNRGKKLQTILDSDVYAGVHMEKVTICADLFNDVFNLLKKVNVTSKTLYGDLNGLARSIHMDLQAYCT